MSRSAQVAALHVSDEEFLVASMIDRCPKTMMLRELLMNAIEAAQLAPPGHRLIEIGPRDIADVPKLSIWNTGPGMSSEELYHICDLAASIGKDKSLDANFGMGAKVASLPSNQYGLRYRSCKGGTVSEVILCKRDGIYGRLRRGEFGEEVIDVTEVAAQEGYMLTTDWTEVVLLGNRREQNTIRDPYNGNPDVTVQWIADYLYHRFYRIPKGVQIKLNPGAHKLGDSIRWFKSIPDRADFFARHEAATVANGIRVHYFYDAPLRDTSHNMSVSGAVATDLSICGIVYKDELYDVRKGRQWTLDAPIFGIPFGAKHISVHIELPDDSPVRPEAYRQFLRYREGDQRQVTALDFGDIVREHRPAWLIDIINSLAPADSASSDEIRDELQKLLNSLRVKARSPRLVREGDVFVAAGAGRGAKPSSGANGSRSGEGAKTQLDDLAIIPAGARKATIVLNAERAPKIILLREEEQIEEKGLKGKAAKFYSEPGELYLNMQYSSIAEMRELLEREYADAPDPDTMRRMALEFSERSAVIRVGRAVVYALAKQLNREWTREDVEKALSPESLSLAADDFSDALQNVRRRIGKALRVARQPTFENEFADETTSIGNGA
jgi:hypothetical protein